MARVYVSSTYSDLKEHRERVRLVLRQWGHEDVAMEYYVAEDKRPVDRCLEDVAASDLYIGIFAWRYGYIPPGYDRSITKLELRRAIAENKSRLIFLADENANWPPNLIEFKAYDKVEALRNELMQESMVSFFTSPEDLASKLAAALKRWEQEHQPTTDRGAAGVVSLEEARRRLAELPLEEVPDVAPLPPSSRMPLSPNPLFVGREDELKDLAANLKAGDTTAIGQVKISAATGLDGIGKTQLASEFVHRYGQYFAGGVYWLSFAEASGVPAEVAACGGAGGMELRPDFGVLPLEDRVREVTSAWQSALPRLLVFDNCEDEELLAQWRPPTGGCRVLVTSRRERWDPTLGVRALPLNVLRREESIALLREHRPDLPAGDPDLDAIAEELGDLPLALQLAGSYLAKYHFAVTPADYLAQLRRPDLLKHRSLGEEGISPTGHAKSVAHTFELSYGRLDTTDPTDKLALALLARAARFAPGKPIPRDLLLSTLDLPEDDSDARLQAEDTLARLAELGLLETEEAGKLRLHRLLAAFIRSVVGDPEAQAAVEAALLEAVNPLLDEGYPAPLLVLQPHLQTVTATAREREDEQVALLCNQLGYYLQMIGEYEEARPLYERS